MRLEAMSAILHNYNGLDSSESSDKCRHTDSLDGPSEPDESKISGNSYPAMNL